MLVYFGVPRETVRFMGRELPLTLFLYLAGAASFYLARFAYAAKPASTDLEKNESWLSNAYTITAGIVILCVSFYEVQTRLVTLTWAVSALLLFAVGFFLKDKIFRYSAIGVVLISLLRGIFVDLAGVNTFYRIIVFICLGVVLMAVSFWYAKIPAEGKAQGPSGGVEAKTVSVMSVVLIALFVLAGAFFYPSDHRKEDKELSREVAVTARFIAGNELDGEEALFLRGRKFRRLEQMLLSRDLRNEDDPDIYFRAMDLGLESRSVYSKLASYYIGRKEKTKALNMYEKGIALDPGIKEWDTRYMLRSAAALYKETENYKKAAEYYEKYLKFYKNATDLYELAVCYEHTGELDKALEKLTEALNADRGGQYSSEINTLRSDIYSKKAMFEEKEKAQPAEGAK
jgi:tetratricopeptide (TPR) repeat protein